MKIRWYQLFAIAVVSFTLGVITIGEIKTRQMIVMGLNHQIDMMMIAFAMETSFKKRCSLPEPRQYMERGI